MDKRREIAMPAKTRRRTAPHQFVLDALTPLGLEVRPMFSGFAVYVGEKIVLMLRDSLKHPADNGVWLVFSESANLADPGIARDFPSLRDIELLGGKIALAPDPCRQLYIRVGSSACMRASPQGRPALRSCSSIKEEQASKTACGIDLVARRGLCPKRQLCSLHLTDR